MRVIARQWARGNRKAREDLARLGNGRVLSIRYEDLMEDTETVLRRIYDHCGLACGDGIVRAAKEMVDPGRQEKWHRLDRDKLKAILPEVQDEMAFYGYGIPSGPSMTPSYPGRPGADEPADGRCGHVAMLRQPRRLSHENLDAPCLPSCGDGSGVGALQEYFHAQLPRAAARGRGQIAPRRNPPTARRHAPLRTSIVRIERSREQATTA